MEIPRRIDLQLHQLWFPLKRVVFNDPWGGIGVPLRSHDFFSGILLNVKKKTTRVQFEGPTKISQKNQHLGG